MVSRAALILSVSLAIAGASGGFLAGRATAPEPLPPPKQQRVPEACLNALKIGDDFLLGVAEAQFQAATMQLAASVGDTEQVIETYQELEQKLEGLESRRFVVLRDECRTLAD